MKRLILILALAWPAVALSSEITFSDYASWAAAAGGNITSVPLTDIGMGGAIVGAINGGPFSYPLGGGFTELDSPTDIPCVTEACSEPVVSQLTLVWEFDVQAPCTSYAPPLCPITVTPYLSFPATNSFFFEGFVLGAGDFGVVSSTPISSYTFPTSGVPDSYFLGDDGNSGPSAAGEITNFYEGSTPEPNTLILFCGGLVGLAFVLRRKLPT
jgi:hypothetical protein